MIVIYEKSFNLNEWFIIISLVLMSILIWITPKIFSILDGTAYFVYGLIYGMFYDHTISVRPWDFYDVNDSSAYQVMDFLSYVMYGPYSYFFLYFYVKLRIKGFMHIYYVLAWTCLSLLLQWFGIKIGLYHFDKGFKMYWSIPIYIMMQSMLLIYYHLIENSKSRDYVP
jgi:hypothetical protein